MKRSLEENIIDFINKVSLNTEESVDFIDNLYWADWDILKDEYPEKIDEIFAYLRSEELSDREISKILKLYNNPHSAYIDRFAKLILDIYHRNKERFLKALSLESEEAINLVYIFRMNDIKLDEDVDLINLLSSEELSEEERQIAADFLKMYQNICNT